MNYVQTIGRESLVSPYTDFRENISIIVFFSHEEGENSAFVKNMTAEIQKQHSKDISDGLLQV